MRFISINILPDQFQSPGAVHPNITIMSNLTPNTVQNHYACFDILHVVWFVLHKTSLLLDSWVICVDIFLLSSTTYKDLKL